MPYVATKSAKTLLKPFRIRLSSCITPNGYRPHLNQALANQLQLIEAGVPQSQIVVSSLCTQCRADLFFSYRREGKHAGRLMSIIGLAP
jgi:copper oxidase (laccase) domain-containing protein